MPSKRKLKVKRIKEQQYAKDEKAATDFMERSVMCAEVTLPGPVARSIARYISNLQQESDNDLSGIIAMSEELMETSGQLVEQNAKYKADLAAMTERAEKAEANDAEINACIAAFQDRVRDAVIDMMVAHNLNDDVDGSGSDGGWDDLTLAEVCIGLNRLGDALVAARADADALRAERDHERELANDARAALKTRENRDSTLATLEIAHAKLMAERDALKARKVKLPAIVAACSLRALDDAYEAADVMDAIRAAGIEVEE